MSRTAEIASELQYAQESIKTYVPLLEKYGYALVANKIDETSQLTADSAVFTFVNAQTRMQISLAFSPPFRNTPRMFIVIIKNESGHPFYVAEYLKAHGQHDLLNKFTDNDSTAPPSRLWQSFFSVLEHLLTTDLGDIIQGKRWEETPIDWGDYR